MLNRTLLKLNFSRNAENYDKTAHLQKQIADKLLNMVSLKNPDHILDIGCGTGYLTGLLQNRFPESTISGLDCAEGMLSRAKANYPKLTFSLGDAEELPYPDLSFDLITSSTTYQWVPDLDQAFLEVNRTLKSDGQFVFSMFGGNTLCELRDSYAKAFRQLYPDRKVPLHEYISMAQLADELDLFQTIILKKEIITSFVTELSDLFKLIKSWGAQNAQQDRIKGLGNRQLLKVASDQYDLLRTNNILPVTWEIIYAKVRKKS